MANRIIKESICSSEKIASLTDFEFRLWVGLITQVDDAGRGDARPAIIKGHVFPLRERVSTKDIDAALQALAAKGCISLYTVGGKSYFWFPGWAKHQRIRDSKPKYPSPEDGEKCGANLPSADIRGSSLQVAANCGLNPIQSESNPNPNPTTTSAEPQAALAPAAILLPLNTGEMHSVTEAQVREWSTLYPAVDIQQELRSMRGWLDANPERRKTKKGINRFIVSWLSKCQNQGGNRRSTAASSAPRSASARKNLASEDEILKSQQEAVRRMQKFLREHEQEGGNGP